MGENGRGYQAYLVRLWQVESGGQAVWRAYTQDAHSGECRAFSCLADLFAFLQETTERDQRCTEATGVLADRAT